MAEPLRGASKFKASSRKGTSRAFRPPKGNRQYLIIDFVRNADNQSYHYIFSLKRDFTLSNIKQDILYLFKKLKEWNIIKRGHVSTISI